MKRIITAALVLAACSDAPVSILPDDVEIRLLNPVEWPAQELVLRSEAFAAYGGLPEILLDSTPLLAVRADDSTVTAVLPDSAGDYDLTVRYRGGRRTGTIRLAGYRVQRTAPALSGWPLPLAPGAPVVIANANDSVKRIDLRTGQSVTLPIPVNEQCILSPGPSYRTNATVTSRGGNCSGTLSWHLGPGTMLDSGPGNGNYLRAETAPGVWFSAGHHHAGFSPAPASQPSSLGYQLEEVERLILSPSGLLAAPLLQSSHTVDVPVFNAASGTVAYRVPMRQMMGAAFSPAGDTLFAAGQYFGPDTWQRFVSMLPNGQVVMLDSINTGQIFDLVLDTDTPFLFALAYGRVTTYYAPVIYVIDRASMALLATMRVPESAKCLGFCNQVILGLDRATNRIYAIGVYGWMGVSTEPTRIWEFDLVPLQRQPVVLGY